LALRGAEFGIIGKRPGIRGTAIKDSHPHMILYSATWQISFDQVESYSETLTN
jgi:hypothetical protein